MQAAHKWFITDTEIKNSFFPFHKKKFKKTELK